jgi:hypothetical protein
MRNFLQRVRHLPLNLLARFLRWRGCSSYMAPQMAEAIQKDLYKVTGISWRQKWWAYRHGFLGRSIHEYGLTPDNFQDYVPDFAYYFWFPINNGYRRWIDDKLTTRYILAPFADHLPRYYYHLLDHRVLRLMDCPAAGPASWEGILDLLETEQHLALKREAGSYGEGFYKLSKLGGRYAINRQQVDRNAVLSLLSECNSHLVTEYIIGHKDLRRIYPHTPNTLRVLLIHDPADEPFLAGAFLRFGSSTTGVVDNASAGGLFCGVALEDGRWASPRQYREGRLVDVPFHPDTGERIEGAVPFWGQIRETLIAMAMHMPQLAYLGFDVLITDSGFKVIEINSHSGLARLQQYYPLLKQPRARRFFAGFARDRSELVAGQPKR